MVKFSVQLPDFIWTVEATCSLLQKPFQRELVLQQFAAPYDSETIAAALSELGIACEPKKLKPSKLRAQSFPVLVWLALAAPTESEPGATDLVSAPDPTSKNSGGLRPASSCRRTPTKRSSFSPAMRSLWPFPCRPSRPGRRATSRVLGKRRSNQL